MEQLDDGSMVTYFDETNFFLRKNFEWQPYQSLIVFG